MPIVKITQNGMKNAPKNMLKDDLGAKHRGQNTSAGKTSEKRKAPNVAEKCVHIISPSCASIEMT